MTANYTYNGNGQRVKKNVNGTTAIFHYSLNGQLIAESNSAGTITAEYVYLNGQPLAKMEGDDVYYYHNDHLATPQKMTDSSGAVVWSADYKPFGEATITVSTITNNLRFPGQYYDVETGTHYNYFRDYNPVIGRYIERDPIGQLAGPNIYLYVLGNPIRFKDRHGLQTQCNDPHTQCQAQANNAYNACMNVVAATGDIETAECLVTAVATGVTVGLLATPLTGAIVGVGIADLCLLPIDSPSTTAGTLACQIQAQHLYDTCMAAQ